MLILRFAILFSSAGLGLFGPLDRIQKALEKDDFEKAFELIHRGYEKDPANPGFHYYHAHLLFTASYPRFNADSARLILKIANEKLAQASDEMIADLHEDGVNAEMFELLGIEIRDFLLHKTLSNVSIATVTDYLTKYPDTPYTNRLIFKRDSMVFRRVKRVDTQEGYLGFKRNYPSSIFINQADSLLDKLRYLDLVNTGSLQDYLNFRSQYPSTNRLEEVEEYILKVSTASHSTASFTQFIESGSIRKWQKRAADVHYYLSGRDYSSHPLKDSLSYATELSSRAVFPVMDHDIFGFHNTLGSMQIPYSFDDIQKKLKCTVTYDDWLFVWHGSRGEIILKDGRVIVEEVDAYESISDAVALVDKNEFRFLYHKSGFRIIEVPIESAVVLANGWVKVARNNKWGLYTLLGLQIADVRYDDIFNLGSLWVFERNGKLALYPTEQILEEVEENGLDLEFKFDDLELVNESLLIGFKGNEECLIDKNLNFLIPWGEYEIHPDPSGWYLRSDDGYYLYNNTDERIINNQYSYLESNDRWLSLRADEDWILIPRRGQMNPKRGYDSIKLINPGALLFRDNQKVLTFNNGSEIALDDHEIRTFPNQPDYLLIRKDGALGLYNQDGDVVFDGKYDDLRFINDSLLRITNGNKQGIITKNGAFLLNPIFETLDIKEDLILTLYKGGIGCYDLTTKTLIPPDFESRIEKIGDYYLAKKAGAFGLIDSNAEEVLRFRFEEISMWNDTSYLVRDRGLLSIMNAMEDTLAQGISGLDLLYEQDGSRLFRFVQDGKFGVISNDRGLILKPEYSDIINIGNDDPLFFADQHLSNAGFHVVSYVNKEGALIFAKAYSLEEFDRILCEDY